MSTAHKLKLKSQPEGFIKYVLTVWFSNKVSLNWKQPLNYTAESVSIKKNPNSRFVFWFILAFFPNNVTSDIKSIQQFLVSCGYINIIIKGVCCVDSLHYKLFIMRLSCQKQKKNQNWCSEVGRKVVLHCHCDLCWSLLLFQSFLFPYSSWLVC